MALTDILEKIDQDTAKKISQLEDDFKKKKKELEEKYKERQKMIDEDLHNRVDEKSKKIIEKAETLADMEGKSALLNAKRQLINDVLEAAIKDLASADNYEELLVSMLKATDLQGENIVVIAAKGKEDATKAAIKESGKDYFVSDKSANIQGGFILKTDKVEIDNSFETIVHKQLREDLEISLHNTLF